MKAHRPSYHSTLGSRVMKKKSVRTLSVDGVGTGKMDRVDPVQQTPTVRARCPACADREGVREGGGA